MDPFLLKTLHLAGAFVLLSSLGAILLSDGAGKAASRLHGAGLVLLLLVGFAILRKPPMDQGWWMVKLGLWVFLGVAPVLARRKVLPAPVVLVLVLVAAVGAAWLGLRKPF